MIKSKVYNKVLAKAFVYNKTYLILKPYLDEKGLNKLFSDFQEAYDEIQKFDISKVAVDV